MSNELAILNGAESALAAANSIPDLMNFRTLATAARAFAKSRKGEEGIELENKAAEFILRAERKLGNVLIDMAESGERATEAGSGRSIRDFDRGKAAGSMPDPRPHLSDLGISSNQSGDFQRLARLPDDVFESMLAQSYAARERIAKINFYRIPDKPSDGPETQGNPAFGTFMRAAMTLLDGDQIRLLPTDELIALAATLQQLVAAYQRVKETRRG